MRRFQILLALLAASGLVFGQQFAPAAAAAASSSPEPQDQPGQPVARLSVINGEASVRRGDSGDWVAAALNAPLMAGDSISVAPGGSAELQLDYADFVRISGDSEIRISQLDNGRQPDSGIQRIGYLAGAARYPECIDPIRNQHTRGGGSSASLVRGSRGSSLRRRHHELRFAKAMPKSRPRAVPSKSMRAV